MSQTRPPTVFHYYARYRTHPSGVTDSINNWVAATASRGMRTRILAARPRGGGANEFEDRENTISVRHIGKGRSTWIPVGLARALRRGDALVLHEGWVLSNAFAALVAQLRRVPYILVPHGVYEPGIVKETRDQLGLRTKIERWVIRHAATVHVFYGSERGTVRSIEPRVKSFMVHPNGAPTSQARWSGRGDFFLWIGRFDPHHKGLDNLIRSWAQLPQPRPQLTLAGPDFRGGKERVQRLVDQFGLTGTVTLRGRVAGEIKRELMSEARAYVHPSRWESCSIMLLEMLGQGVPSLISASIHAAKEMGPSGIALVVDFDPQSRGLAQAIAEVDRNAQLGDRAREWARHDGSWECVGLAFKKNIETIQRSYA